MRDPTRRRVLAASATLTGASLAGCVGSITGGGGPAYEQGTKENLLLTIDAFPDGWVRNDQINDDFDRTFTSDDETVIVLISAEIFEDVGSAEDRVETARAGVSEPNDYPLAEEAFWATRNEQIAATLFRDSNAVGQVAAVRESGAEVVPDQSRSQDYAETMYEQW